VSAKKVIFIVCLSVKLANGAEHEPDELSQLSIEALMSSKVVTATRTEQRLMDTAAAAYVITQDDIRRSGATTIPDALRMVPGLQVARVNPSKWAIAARGFNGQFSDKLLVLMDGRSLYSPINSGVYWEVQDRLLDDIERIEVIRGPGASLWGANAVNGVINIITKHAADTKEGNLTFFGGDKNGVGLRKSWQFTDNGHVRVYGKFNQQAGFNLNGNAANEDWTSGRGGFRADWANPNGKHALMMQGDIYYGVYTENFEKFNGDSLTPVDKTGGNAVARWNYNRSLASKMSVQFVYDAFQEVHLKENSYNSELFDVDFQHVLALNKAHELTWGLNYRLSSVQIIPNAPSDIYSSPVIYSPDTIDTNRFGAFFQDKWQWSDAVEITLGSKLEPDIPHPPTQNLHII
jgi:iron complex outermembrane recepter protein